MRDIEELLANYSREDWKESGNCWTLQIEFENVSQRVLDELLNRFTSWKLAKVVSQDAGRFAVSVAKCDFEELMTTLGK